MFNIFLPMTGFESQTSGIGSNCCTNWATTTAQLAANFCFVSFIIFVRAKDNEINEPWWQPSSFHRAAVGRHWMMITFGIEAKILVEPLPRLLKKCFKANTTTIKKTNYEEEKSFSIFGFSNYNFVSKEILCFLKKDSYIL